MSRPDAEVLLRDLAARGILLDRVGAGLSFQAPAGALTAADRAAIAAARVELLDLLADQPGLPATALQQRIWVASSAAPAGAYLITSGLDLFGSVDTAALATAWLDVCQRHPALRTGFVLAATGLRQLRLDAGWAPVIEQVSPTAWPAAAAAAEQAAAREPFGIDGNPLARLRLTTDGNRHRLSLGVHHLVFDGVSAQIVLRDLATAYQQRCAGTVAQWQTVEPSLPAGGAAPSPAEVLSGVQFWQHQLADWQLPVRFEPAARLAPAVEPAVHVCDRKLAPALGRAVANTARTSRATPFMALLTAILVVLRNPVGTDTAVAVPMSVRDAEHADSVGLFLNTVPIGWRQLDGARLSDVLATVREHLLGAAGHADCDFDLVVAGAAPAAVAARAVLGRALSDVLVSYDAGGHAVPEFPGARTEVRTGTATAPKYPLTIVITGNVGGSTALHLEGDARMLPAGWLTEVATGVVAVLAALSTDSSALVTGMPEVSAPAARPAGLLTDQLTEELLTEELLDGDRASQVQAVLAQICELWSAELNVPMGSARMSFFELGGTSRQLVGMHRRLVETVGIEFAVVELFRYPTAAGLARYLAGHGRDAAAQTAQSAAESPSVAGSRRASAQLIRRRRSGAGR